MIALIISVIWWLKTLDWWNISHAFLRKKKIGQRSQRILLLMMLCFPWHGLRRGHWLAPLQHACGSTHSTRHAFGPVSRTCVYACLCGYLWPQLDTVQPARGAACVTVCSWVSASGFVLLEEFVICTEILWGLRVRRHSGPRGPRAGGKRVGSRLCSQALTWRETQTPVQPKRMFSFLSQRYWQESVNRTRDQRQLKIGGEGI